MMKKLFCNLSFILFAFIFFTPTFYFEFFKDTPDVIQNPSDTLLDICSESEIVGLYNINKSNSILINDTFSGMYSKDYCLKENYIILNKWYEYKFKKHLNNVIVFCPIQSNLKTNYIKVNLPKPLLKGKYRLELLLAQNSATSLIKLKVIEFLFTDQEIRILEQSDNYYQNVIESSLYATGGFKLYPHIYYDPLGFDIFKSTFEASGNEEYLYLGIYVQNKKFNDIITRELDSLSQFNLNYEFYKKKYSIFYPNQIVEDAHYSHTFMPYFYIKRITIVRE